MEKKWKKIYIDNKETFYSVSNYGEIKNDSTNTLLTGSVSNNGYVMVHLHYRIDKVCSVHRLVMRAFHPTDDMEYLQVNHIDGNKLNNKLDNLEWITSLENMRHSFINNLQPNEMKKCYQYDLEGNFIQEFVNGNEASKQLGLHVSGINRCLNEEQYKCGNYQFKTYKKNKINSWKNTKTKKVYVYNESGEFLKAYDSQISCATDLGITQSMVSRCINKTRNIKGFVFSDIPL